MSLSKLLKTPQAELINDKGEPMKPTEAWTPSVVENGDGTTNLTAVRNLSEGKPSRFEELLRSEGYDPTEYMVAPNGVQVKNWEALRKAWVEDDSERGGHHETEKVPMRGYKLTIVKRPYGAVDVDELAELVSSKGPVALKKSVGGTSFLYAQADGQIGKNQSDGAKGTIERFKETTAKAVREAKADPSVTSIVIAFLGDQIEGFVSQGGRNAWQTSLTLTEQLRIVRRLYLHAIDAFVDAGYRDIRVVAVPGNHGQTIRQPITTRTDDNHDSDCLVAVADAIALNPERYGGVQCYVPGPDEWYVCLNIEGVNVGFQHGHQHRPGQHWRYWEGQTFGQTELGKCTVLLEGHSHHTHIEERDKRTYAMAPSLEGCSEWFKEATGITGHPGALIAKFRDNELEEIRKIHATYRGESVHAGK